MTDEKEKYRNDVKKLDIRTKPAMAAVVVAMAGMIRPATSLVL